MSDVITPGYVLCFLTKDKGNKNLFHWKLHSFAKTFTGSLQHVQSDKEFLAVTSQNVYIFI